MQDERVFGYRGVIVSYKNFFITNDESYTKKPRKDAYYRDFSLDNGRETKNKMSWDKRASNGTIGNRDKTIKLSDSYTIKWEDYSDKGFL